MWKLDVWEVLDEEDDGVDAAEAEVDVDTLVSGFSDLRLLFFLDEGDSLHGDVAWSDSLVANGTDESSMCSIKFNNKNLMGGKSLTHSTNNVCAHLRTV